MSATTAAEALTPIQIGHRIGRGMARDARGVYRAREWGEIADRAAGMLAAADILPGSAAWDDATEAAEWAYKIGVTELFAWQSDPWSVRPYHRTLDQDTRTYLSHIDALDVGLKSGGYCRCNPVRCPHEGRP